MRSSSLACSDCFFVHVIRSRVDHHDFSSFSDKSSFKQSPAEASTSSASGVSSTLVIVIAVVGGVCVIVLAIVVVSVVNGRRRTVRSHTLAMPAHTTLTMSNPLYDEASFASHAPLGSGKTAFLEDAYA
eukprot:m.178176 g.178176  ORF g.178176 m.178176 type:complete len:129 (+) comp53384_c0_seq1:422-808(+)